MAQDDIRGAISSFLVDQLGQSLRTVDYEQQSFSEPADDRSVEERARADVDIRHAVGASDALYLITAFKDQLLLQVQLNIRRFVIIFRIPAKASVNADLLRPRFHMWERGAGNVGWEILWRDSISQEEDSPRYVEIYCYAYPKEDFLESNHEQIFWRTDIVQMTRSFMLEARSIGVHLSPAAAGYEV